MKRAEACGLHQGEEKQPKDCQIQIGVHTYVVSRELKLALRAVISGYETQYNELQKVLAEERARADDEIRKMEVKLREALPFEETVRGHEETKNVN